MQKRLLVEGEDREGGVLLQEREGGDQLLLHISSVHHCLLLVPGRQVEDGDSILQERLLLENPAQAHLLQLHVERGCLNPDALSLAGLERVL